LQALISKILGEFQLFDSFASTDKQIGWRIPAALMAMQVHIIKLVGEYQLYTNMDMQRNWRMPAALMVLQAQISKVMGEFQLF
jgi:hypothetical protein